MDEKKQSETEVKQDDELFETTELEDEDLEDVSGGNNTGCNCNCNAK